MSRHGQRLDRPPAEPRAGGRGWSKPRSDRRPRSLATARPRARAQAQCWCSRRSRGLRRAILWAVPVRASISRRSRRHCAHLRRVVQIFSSRRGRGSRSPTRRCYLLRSSSQSQLPLGAKLVVLAVRFASLHVVLDCSCQWGKKDQIVLWEKKIQKTNKLWIFSLNNI